MFLLSPQYWRDYELIDSGNFKKLERFASVITIRPEPQAVWDASLSEEEWRSLASVEYIPASSHSGKWKKHKVTPDTWNITYYLNGNELQPLHFRLALTAFKHVGIFPEQAANWEFIYNECKNIEQSRILNLFAYTGAASLVAARAGASVTHVDSVKQVINWASGNASMNQISTIRWIIDDAMKFVKREIRRGNRYHGIILDPPAFGHGPKGEDWKLERDINEMLKCVLQLAHHDKFFMVLNIYSLGFSALILENLAKTIFAGYAYEVGELFVVDRFQKKLPLGVFMHVKK